MVKDNTSKKDVELRLCAIKEWKKIREEYDAGYVEALNWLANSMNVSPMTIRRWEKRYDRAGVKGLMRQGRSDKGKSRSICKWSEIFLADYLAAHKKASRNEAARAVEKAAIQCGIDFCDSCTYNTGELGSCKFSGCGPTTPNRHSVNRAFPLQKNCRKKWKPPKDQ